MDREDALKIKAKSFQESLFKMMRVCGFKVGSVAPHIVIVPSAEEGSPSGGFVEEHARLTYRIWHGTSTSSSIFNSKVPTELIEKGDWADVIKSTIKSNIDELIDAVLGEAMKPRPPFKIDN